MRLNQYVARATGLSRRAADEAIRQDRVAINGHAAALGTLVAPKDTVTLDGRRITADAKPTTLILNKPAGYVVSRHGQGSKTIYDLLPAKYHHLKPVGRLDKDSSGLLILTNDGELANRLTHPRYAKIKVYEVILDKPLEPLHHQMISDYGIQLDDGPSKLSLHKLDGKGLEWQVTMSEGRNRQVRRTFDALGYQVRDLHRTEFGDYKLGSLKPALFQEHILL
jgi:23S rRNA pseudouridine2605 synthase